MSSLIEDCWTLICFNLWYGFWLKYMKKNPVSYSWKGADFSDNWEYSSDPTSKLKSYFEKYCYSYSQEFYNVEQKLDTK